MAAPPNLEYGVAPLDLPAPMQPHGREELLPARGQGQWPGGATPRPTPGAAAQNGYPKPDARGGGPEPLPTTGGQGRWPVVTMPHPRPRAEARRHYPPPEVRSSVWEALPYARCQGWRPGGATPRPRSRGCAGAGGPRGAVPCSMSGGAAVRRYPSSKVRSSACA